MFQMTVIIDGNNFSDLESFYDEIDRVLTKDLNFKTGHNLDAFYDILCGDFGVFSYSESLKLIWANF
jgi:RNAse (barnase) inhibitor barstar